MLKIFILIFILITKCSTTEQIQIYNPYPDKELILERKNSICSDSKEIKVWYILYGSYPLNTVNTRDFFPTPEYSYKIDQVSTIGDKIISVFTGVFFSISRKTYKIDTCQIIKKELETSSRLKFEKPENNSYESSKISELEKEVAYLKGKIAGIESTVSMIQSTPATNQIQVEQQSVEIPQVEKRYASKYDPEEEKYYTDLSGTEADDLNLAHYLFKLNSYKLSSSQKEKLTLLKEILENNKMKILVIGYADRTGKFKTNLHLSWKRAVEVKKNLVKLGIKDTQVQVTAAGEVSNLENAKKIWQFRRVDIYLLENKL